MNTQVTKIEPHHEPTAWLRWQVQTAEKRRDDLMFGQCGHLTAPSFNGCVIFWDPEARVCADCIRNMHPDPVTPSCDRCGASGELHPCLTRSDHTKYAFALCPGCLEREIR